MQEPPGEPLTLKPKTRDALVPPSEHTPPTFSTRTAPAPPPRIDARDVAAQAARPVASRAVRRGEAAGRHVRAPRRRRPPPMHPAPRRREEIVDTIRPCSSSGNRSSPASGAGFTPAVQTRVSASNVCRPSTGSVRPRPTPAGCAAEPRCAGAPAGPGVAREILAVARAGSPAPASTRTHRISSLASSDSSSARREPGPPVRPALRPPRTPRPRTRTSAPTRRRSGSSVCAATSSRDSTWLRR